MPLGQNFCTTVFYSSLPSIWYATWLCLYKIDFEPFWATPPLALPPGVTSKFQMWSSSPHPLGYYLWQVQGSSSKSLRGVVWQSKKKRPKILLFNQVTPRHAPGDKNFCTTVFYSSLSSMWYATWLCLYKMDFGPFWATSAWPCPQGLHQNSECVPPVLIHRAIACEIFKILA